MPWFLLILLVCVYHQFRWVYLWLNMKPHLKVGFWLVWDLEIYYRNIGVFHSLLGSLWLAINVSDNIAHQKSTLLGYSANVMYCLAAIMILFQALVSQICLPRLFLRLINYLLVSSQIEYTVWLFHLFASIRLAMLHGLSHSFILRHIAMIDAIV